MTENETIMRRALGRAAVLGSLYDARKEQFCGFSLFSNELPDELIVTTDMPNTKYEFDFSDTYEEKFKKLDIQAELKISVLSGLFKLEGSGKYLGDEKENKKSVKGSIIYEITTKQEQFYVSNSSLKSSISYDSLCLNDATHVVVGIKWGANMVASFEYKNDESFSKKEIEGNLKAFLQKAAFSISGEASVNYNEAEKNLKKNVNIKVFGDILSQNEELPQTFEAALELMKKVPLYVKEFNKGKGSPLEYHLCPLNKIEEFFGFENKVSRVLKVLKSDTVKRIENEFDDFTFAKQELNDFYQEIMFYNDFITDSIRDEIGNKKTEILIGESGVRERLGKALINVRSGLEEFSVIENILNEFQESNYSSTSIKSFISQHHQLKSYISKIQIFKKHKIEYVSKLQSIETIILENNDKKLYIYYTCDELERDQKKLYDDTSNFFINLSKSKEDNESLFFIVNYDLHNVKQSEKLIKIEFYYKGKLVDKNYYETKMKDSEYCHARSQFLSTKRKPLRTRKIQVPCPGMMDTCSNNENFWKCEKCKTDIEYGYDKTFYCECGGAPAETYEMKCNSPFHPNKYLKFKFDELAQFLPHENDENEINILLLGETGVGKSTFINGLVNYFSYSTFDDAAKGELKVAIPSQFSITDENFEEKLIKIGNSDNESDIIGQSSTQNARAHVFHIDNFCLRIIDTPGIGDTRGIDVDKQNFENTLEYISYFPHLNGVCILLKPNNARLGVTFRFCIKELLTHLHKSAKDNIVFCFTNSRSTFYKPGDTFTPLKKLLKEMENDSGISVPVKENVFCFDNESFRFLAAYKNGVNFAEDEMEQFSNSWKYAVETTEKMISYIKRCPLHNTRDTVSLNASRRLISELSKPIAEITQLIQNNIKLAEDKKKELQDTRLSVDDLKNKLFIPQKNLKPIDLDRPRTVCTNSSCVKVYQKNDQEFTTDYVTICHDNCGLTNVNKGQVAHTALQGCAAMSNGVCTVCGCGWIQHMHVTYKNEIEIVNVIDSNIQTQIRRKQDIEHEIEKTKKGCEVLVDELKDEQCTIVEVSAKFANFLKNNAIAAYNDDLIKYLDHLIREEEGKNSAGAKNNGVIKGLLDMKNSYEEQKQIYEQTLKKGNQSENVSSEDIQNLIKQLYALKHNGQQLKNIVEKVQHGRTKMNSFKEETHNVPNKEHGLVQKFKRAWKAIF